MSNMKNYSQPIMILCFYWLIVLLLYFFISSTLVYTTSVKMSDDEMEKFEITDYDLDNEFNMNRPYKRMSKNQAIYGSVKNSKLYIWNRKNYFLWAVSLYFCNAKYPVPTIKTSSDPFKMFLFLRSKILQVLMVKGPYIFFVKAEQASQT